MCKYIAFRFMKYIPIFAEYDKRIRAKVNESKETTNDNYSNTDLNEKYVYGKSGNNNQANGH